MEYSATNIVPLWDSAPVLPDQLTVGARRDASICGELALRLALLEDAIRCLALGRGARIAADRQLAREAEVWIRNLDRRWPFSFLNVCEALNIDAVALRRKLIELRYQVVMPPSIDRIEPAI